MTTATKTELQVEAARLAKANTYLDIFPTEDVVGEEYRRIVRIVHPDFYARNDDEYKMATTAFQQVTAFKTKANSAIVEKRWGQPETTITTKRARHEIRGRVGEDELAVYFRAVTVTTNTGTDAMVKVAKSARDNDLMAQEAKALKLLQAEHVDDQGNPIDEKWRRAYPQLLDTFMHSEGRRRTNVTPYYSGFHSLKTIRERFPQGVDPRHGAWMFRRLLMALGYAHEQGLVHGAVTPDNVLIGPADHAVVLIDWCYSLVIDDESKTNFIKAVVPMYKTLYAPEVLDKASASAATDIYMAATMMSWLMPVAPKPFRAFFKGCALTSPAARPQNAWGLLKEFDELLVDIGEPFYPRRFVDFVVPTVGTTA